MRTRRNSSTTFYCFSPPVMIATFAIETILATYTIIRYKLDASGRLIAATLLFLGLFQLSEYFVCGGWGVQAADWSRIGYVAISTLPPLGLHLLYVLSGKRERHLVIAAYTTMAGFIGYFLLAPHAFQGYACTGNYVIFQLGVRPTYVYGLYYYGWLLTAIGLASRWANEFVKQNGALAVRRLQTSRALIIGYLVFLIPTALANSVKPETRSGIPSIMCGFAILFALILVFYILPRAGQRRAHDKIA